MIESLTIKGKTYPLPIFCPDATRGVVKGLDTPDLLAAGVEGMIVNTWHLNHYPGRDFLLDCGGIKKLMGFDGLIISDSGGFQVHSLFQKIPGFGKITDRGLVTYTGPKKQHKIIFRPEDSIRMQFALGSDIVICLDDFTPPSATRPRIEQSVERTVSWAKRCRQEYDRQIKYWRLTDHERPLIFAVIQGHDDWECRRWCAQELLKIGFDGYCLGGQKFNDHGGVDLDWSAKNAQLTPDDWPRYAMGFGKPDEIQAMIAQGYQIFDCVLPTRDARHARMYVHDPQKIKDYIFLNLNKSQYTHDRQPLDPHCQCHTCTTTTREYLHHLYKIGDDSFARLASIHNLHFFMDTTKKPPVRNP